jgi:CRP/FNR family cyclic AMP-dependent transcriptional regulator
VEIHKVLRLVPIYRDLDEEEMDRIAKIAITRYVRKKSIIFNEGCEKEAVYFIQDGLVKAYKTDEEGNEQIVSLLQTGEMFPHTGFKFQLCPLDSLHHTAKMRYLAHTSHSFGFSFQLHMN